MAASEQRLMGRASDSRLRERGFEYCAAVLKPWATCFTLHCPNSLSCINEYLAIERGGYVYEQLSGNCSNDVMLRMHSEVIYICIMSTASCTADGTFLTDSLCSHNANTSK